MAETPSALEILAAPERWQVGDPSLVVLHGDEPFLVLHLLDLLRSRLCPDEADRSWAWREFDGGGDLDPRDVFDEAATIPMFATATRAAVVRNADAFVTAAREQLEAVATAPRGRRGLVMLEVRSFPAHTRLAKAVARQGLAIDASVPARADLAGWIRGWASSRHGITLAAATAQRLLERLGGNLGQIDQALARLAAATNPQARSKAIPPDAVDDCVGSPQERTAWGMVDAAAGGDTKRALRELADLLDSGENPIGIAAQMASVLRRLSTAARLLALPADAGRPAGVEQALREAGVAAWPKALAQAKASLQQLGPRRARRLPVWLLDLDLALKGEASRGLRARLALERLFCKMARGGETAGRSPTASSRPTGARP
ncbi:MAG: DNA polymerase III subunit delta [Planctomycetaceae bacterium]